VPRSLHRAWDLGHFPHTQLYQKQGGKFPVLPQAPELTKETEASGNNMNKWNRFHLKSCYAVCYTLETGKGMSLVLSNACIVMILYLALSLCTPSSLYARYLPSLSLILGDVRGGPPGEPHSFVGGGWRIAWNAQPRSTIGRTKTNLGAIFSRSGAFR